MCRVFFVAFSRTVILINSDSAVDVQIKGSVEFLFIKVAAATFRRPLAWNFRNLVFRIVVSLFQGPDFRISGSGALEFPIFSAQELLDFKRKHRGGG